MPKRRSVAYIEESGCYRCTSHRHWNDRPLGYRDGHCTTIARMVYEDTHGPIPAGLAIHQTCGRVWCVRPEHLKLGKPKPPGHARGPKAIEYQEDANGCWICTSHTLTPAGYPTIAHRGRSSHLSRYVWEQAHGPIPAGMVIRHTCDVPACINVEHLQLGTHADNVKDRVERGRSATGERNGRAKLTWADVAQIKREADAPPAVLARRYGVDAAVIRSIRAGKTWRQQETSHV